MLFLHETHSVIGRHEHDFEDAYGGPGGLRERLEEDDDSRLLWYLDHIHGTGPAYTVVTVTAMRDAAAWERLARRITDGDLHQWMRRVDGLRHHSEAKVLEPLPWSTLQEIDWDDVPTKREEEAPALFMEDTAQPHVGRLDNYIEAAGRQYAPSLRRSNALLELVGAFRPVFGAGPRPEIVLWQRVLDHAGLLTLLTTPLPAAMQAPGTWMHDALELRDRWTSRLLRTAVWSPLR